MMSKKKKKTQHDGTQENKLIDLVIVHILFHNTKKNVIVNK